MTNLTVIIPLYNTEQYIEQCLKTIVQQSLKNIEIIVVDDGSTDQSAKICEQFEQNDQRIRVIHQENKGASGARYAGLKACRTKYVTFVDSDDFILEESYVYASAYMERGIDMIFFEIARYFDEHNIKVAKHLLTDGFYDRDRIERDVYPRLIWNFEKNIPGIECSQCVRITKKELLIKMYEDIDIDLFYGEDTVITYPLYKKISTMQVVPYCYYMHRQRKKECASYIKSNAFLRETYLLYEHLLNEFCLSDEETMFRRQIEYFFIYATQLKKVKYNDFQDSNRFLFPFDKVSYNRKIILYGAGEMGHVFYKQLEKIKYCHDILWVDRNAEYMNDDRIHSVSEIKSYDFDYVVIAIENKEICKSVYEFLITQNIDSEVIIF